jgi:hypothetical protein
MIATPKQCGEHLGQLRCQRRCGVNDVADVLSELGGAKITLGISDGRIIGVSVAFESVVPPSGGIHGLQLNLAAGA